MGKDSRGRLAGFLLLLEGAAVLLERRGGEGEERLFLEGSDFDCRAAWEAEPGKFVKRSCTAGASRQVRNNWVSGSCPVWSRRRPARVLSARRVNTSRSARSNPVHPGTYYFGAFWAFWALCFLIF